MYSQVHFQKYYDAVMPYLKAILVNANDKSNRMLRAKSMECISLVGMAVGKEKFRDDAKQVRINSVSYYQCVSMCNMGTILNEFWVGMSSSCSSLILYVVEGCLILLDLCN